MEGKNSTMEVRTKEIDQQRNIMRTRQSTAEAMRIFKSSEGSVHTNIDDTFEKWGERIMEVEIGVGGLECTELYSLRLAISACLPLRSSILVTGARTRFGWRTGNCCQFCTRAPWCTDQSESRRLTEFFQKVAVLTYNP